MAGKKKANLRVVGGHGQIGHNSGDAGSDGGALSDDQLLALTLNWKPKYVEALKAKKEAAAAFLAVTKKIKAELGDNGIDDIKDMIASEEDGFEEKLKAEVERKARVARWLNLEVGFQADLFGADRQSQQEVGYAEGKRAGMAGEVCKPSFSSGTDGYDGYIKGWHDGQAVLASLTVSEQEEGERLLRPVENEPAAPDAFDTFESDDAESFLEEGEGDAGAAPADPWPDDVATAREPAEAL